MKNKAKVWITTIFMIAIVFIGIGYRIYTHQNTNIAKMEMINAQKLEEEERQNYLNKQTKNEILEASSARDNISPNAIVIQKRYYKSCDHLIRETTDIPDELINKGKKELEKFFSGWKVEQYSPTEITIFKEFAGICNEHYVVKEHNGVLSIFTENKEKVQEWQEDTEIQVQYLPDEDIEKFKVGVKIIGKINLNIFLENFE